MLCELQYTGMYAEISFIGYMEIVYCIKISLSLILLVTAYACKHHVALCALG